MTNKALDLTLPQYDAHRAELFATMRGGLGRERARVGALQSSISADRELSDAGKRARAAAVVTPLARAAVETLRDAAAARRATTAHLAGLKPKEPTSPVALARLSRLLDQVVKVDRIADMVELLANDEVRRAIVLLATPIDIAAIRRQVPGQLDLDAVTRAVIDGDHPQAAAQARATLAKIDELTAEAAGVLARVQVGVSVAADAQLRAGDQARAVSERAAMWRARVESPTWDPAADAMTQREVAAMLGDAVELAAPQPAAAGAQ